MIDLEKVADPINRAITGLKRTVNSIWESRPGENTYDEGKAVGIKLSIQAIEREYMGVSALIAENRQLRKALELACEDLIGEALGNDAKYYMNAAKEKP